MIKLVNNVQRKTVMAKSDHGDYNNYLPGCAPVPGAGGGLRTAP